MLLNLVALFILLALIAIGVAMIIRALLEPAPGANTSCAACGRDAADLVDFTCPGCRQDVRDAGLTSTPLDSAVARFWRAGAITCLAIAAVGFSSAALWRLAPATRVFDLSAELQPGFTSAIERIDMKFDGASRQAGSDQEQTVRGRLVADLAVADGRMTALEVEFPDAAARVIDENGNATAPRPLSDAVVRRWFETAGVDTSGAAGYAATALHDGIARLGRAPGFETYEWRHGMRYFSGGFGGSMHARPPSWLVPVLAVTWGIVWLLAMRRWLRRRVAGGNRVHRDAITPREQTAVPA